MKVVLDGCALCSDYALGGIGTYLRALIQGLPRALGEDETVDVIAPRGLDPAFLGADSRNVRIRTVATPSQLTQRLQPLVIEQLLGARLSRDADLVHSPALSYDIGRPTVMFLPRVPQVITVHDLIPLSDPANFLTTVRRRTWYRLGIRRIAKASAIIAVSRHVARQVRDLCHVQPERISQIYPTQPRHGAPPFDLPTAQWHRSRPFVLAFGATSASKNMELLRQLAVRLAAEPDSAQMVVAGADVRAAAWSSNVDVRSNVPRAELFALMREAITVLVPSFREGFGYPVVEALSSGGSVLALDAPWSRELVIDERLLLPNDVEQWVRSIQLLREGHIRPSLSSLTADLRFRDTDALARETVSVWRQVASPDRAQRP